MTRLCLYIKTNVTKIIFKSTQVPNFIEIRSVGGELCHTDGLKDGRTQRNDEANSRIV